MACNCGTSRRTDGTAKVYVHKAPDGTEKTYDREVDARIAASRLGGVVRPK